MFSTHLSLHVNQICVSHSKNIPKCASFWEVTDQVLERLLKRLDFKHSLAYQQIHLNAQKSRTLITSRRESRRDIHRLFWFGSPRLLPPARWKWFPCKYRCVRIAGVLLAGGKLVVNSEKEELECTSDWTAKRSRWETMGSFKPDTVYIEPKKEV